MAGGPWRSRPLVGRLFRLRQTVARQNAGCCAEMDFGLDVLLGEQGQTQPAAPITGLDAQEQRGPLAKVPRKF